MRSVTGLRNTAAITPTTAVPAEIMYVPGGVAVRGPHDVLDRGRQGGQVEVAAAARVARGRDPGRGQAGGDLAGDAAGVQRQFLGVAPAATIDLHEQALEPFQRS